MRNVERIHGSLEGVGGLKTNKAYHSKADALVTPEIVVVFFFENLHRPFLGNVGFVKFVTFSALLALPVMIRDGYGQIVYKTLPHILLSNASLVAKSCIARFVEDDAFNPSALSDCSTGLSPPLAHAKSTLSPSRASAGCLQPGLFGRFRSICEQTALSLSFLVFEFSPPPPLPGRAKVARRPPAVRGLSPTQYRDMLCSALARNIIKIFVDRRK